MGKKQRATIYPHLTLERAKPWIGCSDLAIFRNAARGAWHGLNTAPMMPSTSQVSETDIKIRTAKTRQGSLTSLIPPRSLASALPFARCERNQVRWHCPSCPLTKENPADWAGPSFGRGLGGSLPRAAYNDSPQRGKRLSRLATLSGIRGPAWVRAPLHEGGPPLKWLSVSILWEPTASLAVYATGQLGNRKGGVASASEFYSFTPYAALSSAPVTDPQSRASLLSMAQLWLALADQAEKNALAPAIIYETPPPKA